MKIQKKAALAMAGLVSAGVVSVSAPAAASHTAAVKPGVTHTSTVTPDNFHGCAPKRACDEG